MTKVERYLPRDNNYLLLAVAITILSIMFYLTDIIGIIGMTFYLSYPILAMLCYLLIKQKNTREKP